MSANLTSPAARPPDRNHMHVGWVPPTNWARRSLKFDRDAAEAVSGICIVGCGRWMMSDDQVGLRVAERLALRRARKCDSVQPHRHPVEKSPEVGRYDCRVFGGVEISTTEDPLTTLLNVDRAKTELLVIIDAASTSPGHPPGECSRFDFREIGVSSADRVGSMASAGRRLGPLMPGAAGRIDTHSLGVCNALELAGALDALPRNVWIYTVTGACFEPGESLSPVVAAAIAPIADQIEADLLDWQNRPAGSGTDSRTAAPLFG